MPQCRCCGFHPPSPGCHLSEARQRCLTFFLPLNCADSGGCPVTPVATGYTAVMLERKASGDMVAALCIDGLGGVETAQAKKDRSEDPWKEG